MEEGSETGWVGEVKVGGRGGVENAAGVRKDEEERGCRGREERRRVVLPLKKEGCNGGGVGVA